jgi:sterol desaturase/sphingolipid hydroxylase (fatty acid hydroxylase superfamily)
MTLLFATLPTLLVGLLLTLCERLRGAPTGDWLRNLQSWGLQLAAAIAILPLMPLWRGAALLDGARLPFWFGCLIFLVVRDLGEYLFHRAQHRVPWLWAMHSLHHSDPSMNALTTQRHFWGDQLVKQLTIWSATLMVITPTPAMVGVFGLISLWHLVVHANLPLDFGRWSWLLNAPGYHRRHHSRLPEHYDGNFAALFPIFDVICGSYHRGEGFPPTGLEHKPESLGELVIWPAMWNRPSRRLSANRA